MLYKFMIFIARSTMISNSPGLYLSNSQERGPSTFFTYQVICYDVYYSVACESLYKEHFIHFIYFSHSLRQNKDFNYVSIWFVSLNCIIFRV